jgi:hypothetical protein
MRSANVVLLDPAKTPTAGVEQAKGGAGPRQFPLVVSWREYPTWTSLKLPCESQLWRFPCL